MKDLLYVERFEQAEALLRPQRVEVLRQLDEPRSCTAIGARLGQTPQRVYYHVKRLVDVGLVTQVSERRVRGIVEGIYQAAARSYWLSPHLIGTIGGRRAPGGDGIGHLIELVEDVQQDLATLDRAGPEQPALGVTRHVAVPAAHRAEFLAGLRAVLADLGTRYGTEDGQEDGEVFTVTLAAYPKPG